MRLTLGAELEPSGSSVVIQDISRTGLSFATAIPLDPGDTIEVRLPGAAPVAATVLRRTGELLACRFEAPIAQSALSAARLRSDPLGNGRSPPAPASPSAGDLPVVLIEDAPDGSSLPALAVVAAALAGFALLVSAGAWTALGVIAAALAFVVALLVLWGNWVLDNV